MIYIKKFIKGLFAYSINIFSNVVFSTLLDFANFFNYVKTGQAEFQSLKIED